MRNTVLAPPTGADSPQRGEMSPQATERGAELSAKLTEGEKSLAEFAPAGANKAPIIFPDDMCVGKNTYRLANVRSKSVRCGEPLSPQTNPSTEWGLFECLIPPPPQAYSYYLS